MYEFRNPEAIKKDSKEPFFIIEVVYTNSNSIDFLDLVFPVPKALRTFST